MNGRSFIILLIAIVAVSFCIGGFIGFSEGRTNTIMTLEIQTLDQNQAIVTFSNGEQHLYDLN